MSRLFDIEFEKEFFVCHILCVKYANDFELLVVHQQRQYPSWWRQFFLLRKEFFIKTQTKTSPMQQYHHAPHLAPPEGGLFLGTLVISVFRTRTLFTYGLLPKEPLALPWLNHPAP